MRARRKNGEKCLAKPRRVQNGAYPLTKTAICQSDENTAGHGIVAWTQATADRKRSRQGNFVSWRSFSLSKSVLQAGGRGYRPNPSSRCGMNTRRNTPKGASSSNADRFRVLPFLAAMKQTSKAQKPSLKRECVRPGAAYPIQYRDFVAGLEPLNAQKLAVRAIVRALTTEPMCRARPFANNARQGGGRTAHSSAQAKSKPEQGGFAPA